jgi:hypothetical protein
MKYRITAFLIILGSAVMLSYALGPQKEPAPAVTDLKPPQETPRKLRNGNVKLGIITLDVRKKEVSFMGTLNPPDQGTLEVLVVSPPPLGRAHEGLVVTHASPYQLEAMLYLLGADNEIKRKQKGKKGSLINIDLEWKDDDGVMHRDPIEKWVLDERTKKIMQRKGFYFCGSNFFKEIYQAEGSGNLCLLYSNTTATVLDCADANSHADILYTTNPQMTQPGAYREVKVIMSLRKER